MNELGLGEILQLRGWINRRQLNRALALQRRLGGRLGTSLLELGAVTEDQLLTVLAAQTGVPKGPIEGLRDLPLSLGKKVPIELARRWRILPVAATADSISVAFENPRDLSARDELAFVTNQRILPLGLHEARIYQGLERLYGLECPPRFSRLLKELDRRLLVDSREGRRNRGREREKPAPPKPGALDSAPPLPGLLPRSHPGALPAAAAAAPAPEPRKAPGSPRLQIVELNEDERAVLTKTLDREALAELPIEQRLLRVSRASDVGEALLDHLEKRYDRVALLRSGTDGLQGWLATGPGLDPEAFSRLRVDSKEPSVFLSLQLGGGFYVGPLARHEANRRFLSCWPDADWPGKCALIPVKSHRQTLCVVYVDSPRSGAEIDVGTLQEVAGYAVKAFESCILRNRLASQKGGIVV